MHTLIELQEGTSKIYLRKINQYLAYGREIKSTNDHIIIFEGYYRFYASKGWKRVSF